MQPLMAVPASGLVGDESHFEEMTAGQLAPGVIGFGGGSGTLDPGVSFFEFNPITIIITIDPNFFQLTVGGPVPDTDEAWRDMSITGFFSGGFKTVIYLRADRANYTPTATTQWDWVMDTSIDAFIPGQFYEIVFTRPPP